MQILRALARHFMRLHQAAALMAEGRSAEAALSGRYDRPTMDALARFQASQGLPVDGFPDAATADALLRAAA